VTEQRIEPQKVTKPIQLLAAWLVGLVLTNGIFLAAALQLADGTWERRALVISAIANVPIFLIALFVLQTRFRAELQEDSYYATYLSQKTNRVVTVEKEAVRPDGISRRSDIQETNQVQLRIPAVTSSDVLAVLFGVNKNLPNAEALKSRLGELGFARCTTFGSDEPPEHLVVSISQYLSDEVRNQVLRIVSEMGFQHYRPYDNQLEESEEDVLLGSYGDPQYEILRQTPNKPMHATCEDARA
jgi:hypothetical protein